MKVTLVDHTDQPEHKVGLFASICYDSNTSEEACIKRAVSCVSKGHLATLRFAYATFKVEGISRACSHQLVRSKHLDYLQASQRYVEEVEVPKFIIPKGIEKEVEAHNYNSYFLYKKLLASGVRKEDARYVLPNATPTSLYVTGNFQAWIDFINLRSGKEVQWEIREVANEIHRMLLTIAPNIFGVLNGT